MCCIMQNKIKEIYGNIIISGMGFCIPLGLSIWGGIEFYNVSCVNNLNDTILYKISYANWIFTIFITGINFISTIISINIFFFDSVNKINKISNNV